MGKPRITTLLLTVTLLTTVVAAANFYVGRNEERAKRVWTEQQLQRVIEAKQALEKERDELTQAKQTLEEQVMDLTGQAKALADQFAQEKRARESLTGELAQVRKEASQFKSQLDSERQAKESLNGELAKAQQGYQALSNELTTLRQAKEALEKRVKEMLAARAKEAEQIVIRPEVGTASAPAGPRGDVVASAPAQAAAPVRGSAGSPRAEGGPVRPEPPIESGAGSVEGRAPLQGKVLVVNREFNFVVLNLGTKDGLKAGNRFAVLKGNKKIGTVEVERLYENMAAANVLEEEKKGQVQEGDTVRLI